MTDVIYSGDPISVPDIHVDLVEGTNSVSADQASALISRGIATADGVLVTTANAVLDQKVITLTAESVTMTDHTTAGSQGTLLLHTFPEGYAFVLGTVTDLTITRVGTALSATAAAVVGIGSGAVAIDNATLDGEGESDLSGAIAATLSGGVGVAQAVYEYLASLDGTDTPASIHLNIAVPDAGTSGDDAFTVTGTVTVTYAVIGDI